MTRTDFMENITSLTDLVRFCFEEDCDICEDLYEDDAYDEQVEEDIVDSGFGWRALRDYLNDLPAGYPWYRRDGTLDYVGIEEDGDEFEDYKSEVMNWMDEREYWEDDDTTPPFPADDEDDETPDHPTDDTMDWLDDSEYGWTSVPEKEDPDDFEVVDVDFIQVFMETDRASVAVASNRVEEGDDSFIVRAGIADCLSKIS